jgi:hypothetical protein
MANIKRLRRALILCVHCARNTSFYRQGWKRKKPVFRGQFLITANSNFLDVAVLEWCKLFGDPKGKHHWAKVVDDRSAFERTLLDDLSLTADQFAAFIKDVRRYRDRFLAHLDDDEKMNIPNLDIIIASVRFLYRYLMSNEAKGRVHDAEATLDGNIREWVRKAKDFYERNPS